MSSDQTYYPCRYAEINGLAAICVRRNGVDSMYYVHPDRLGSYTHITNANKQVIRNLHFDPWGNVKTDTDWRTFDSTTLSGFLAGTIRFSRGFTGHEHYADLKIINMNGRLYDPVIARFFSPDNFVQAPGFTQSYNRYSYCLNNPLQWVDPSGEDLFAPWYKDAIGFVHWIGSVDDMPNYGTFLGNEGVFTSDGEMRYYYADGRISNNKLSQVIIHMGTEATPTETYIAINSYSTNPYPDFIDVGLLLLESGTTTTSENFKVTGIKYYDETKGLWLGKDGQYRPMNVNGNRTIGGKLKYAKATRDLYFVKSNYMRLSGYGLSGFDAFLSISNVSRNNSLAENTSYLMDASMDIIGAVGPLGMLLSLHYTIDIKNYPIMQQEIRRQHYNRNDMIKEVTFQLDILECRLDKICVLCLDFGNIAFIELLTRN